MIVWTLSAIECLGVYSSMEELSKGVDYWMKKLPRSLLSYEEREVDYIPEPRCWEWCYIPLNTKVKRFKAIGVDFMPMKKYWGFNLIELDLQGIQYLEEIKYE